MSCRGSSLLAMAISSFGKVIFSQPCTCCPASSFMLASIRSIKDSPSNTLEHHRHFHLPMFLSNTLKTAYLINLFIKTNNTRLVALFIIKSNILLKCLVEQILHFFLRSFLAAYYVIGSNEDDCSCSP